MRARSLKKVLDVPTCFNLVFFVFFAWIAEGALTSSPADFMLGVSHVLISLLLLSSVIAGVFAFGTASWALAVISYALVIIYGIAVFEFATHRMFGVKGHEEAAVFMALWCGLGIIMECVTWAAAASGNYGKSSRA